MSGERVQTIYSEQDLLGIETHVECYSFLWTIKDFVERIRRNEFQSLGLMALRTGEKDEFFTSWIVELSSLPNNRGECIVEFSLRRSDSKNSSNVVFVRFFCGVQHDGTMTRFPLRIQSDFVNGERVSQIFIKTDSSPETEYFFCPKGSLNIQCTLTVFEKQMEEYISPITREIIPHRFNELSSDMDMLFQSSAYGFISLSANSKISMFYKAVLAPETCTLTEWMKNAVSEIWPRLKSPRCENQLDTLLKHIYSGIMDIYLKHTITTGLNEEEELKLSDLQEYIDYVRQQNIAKLRTLDVTWNVPLQECLQSKLNTLHCPWRDKETFHAKWQFRVIFSSNWKSLGIFIHRNAETSSMEFVKFVVKIIRKDKVMFEKCCYLYFKGRNFQGMPNFITTRQAVGFTYRNSLQLKCSLEIFEPKAAISSSKNDPRLISMATESFNTGSKTNMENLSENLKQLFECGRFSDAVIETLGENFRIHSFILSVRLLTLVSDRKSYYKNNFSAFVKSFIHYLYICNMPKRKFYGSILTNETTDTKISSDKKNPIEKILDFLPRNRIFTLHPPTDTNRDDQVDRNGARSQSSYLGDIENFSSDENEDGRSPKIHDDNNTNAGGRGKQAVFENQITLYPSNVYDDGYSATEAYRDEQVVRSGATSQNSYLGDIVNVSSDENEDGGSLKIHDDNSTNAGDGEKQSVFENQITLHPSNVYDSGYSATEANTDEHLVRSGATSQTFYLGDIENISRDESEDSGSSKIYDPYSKSAENNERESIVDEPMSWHPSHTYGQYGSSFPTNFGNYTIVGNHFIMYPHPAFGSNFIPDHNTPVNASFMPAQNSVTEYEPPAKEQYSECDAETITWLQHPSLINTETYCTPLIPNSQVPMPMILPQFTDTNFHYNTCEPQYASNQLISQNYQSFYQPNYHPNYQWKYPYPMYEGQTLYTPYNNGHASLAAVENNSVVPYGYYYPMVADQSGVFHPSYANIGNLPLGQNAYYETSGVQGNWSNADAFQPAFQANFGFH